MLLNKNRIKSNELDSLAFFERMSKEVNAEWDGEEFILNDSKIGEVNSISFNYLDNVFIGITKLKFKKEYIFQNTPIDGEEYISIRIGRVGAFENESNQKIRDSIYVYNSHQEFSITYPENVEMRWVFIRFPKKLYQIFSSDKDSDFYKLISRKDGWFFYSPMLLEIDTLINEMLLIDQDKGLRRGVFFAKAIEIITRLKVHGVKNHFKNVIFDLHPKDLDLMLQIKDKILLNYVKPPNVEALSLEMGISISKMQKTFKKVFNMPILQFFNYQRTLEAQRLIKRTTKDFTEIAYELGYSDLSHFSKVYAKFIGYRPSEEARDLIKKKIE